ncbi:hypothetical protein [Rummeliibacillus sp. BSL5]
MEVGYHLNQEEITALISSFKQKQKFQNLMREIKRYSELDFDTEKAEVIQALKFDTTKGEQVITAKALVLQFSDKVNIRYITRYLNGDLETTNDFFVGTLNHNSIEEPEKILQTVMRASDDNVVSVIKNEFDEEAVEMSAEANEKFEEEFNYDENYEPGQLVGQVDAQSPIKGCIAGGYIYCGDSCGGYPACKSTKSGVNGLDNCCKTHDCCYNTYGVGYPHCYCDQQLCDCAQAAPFAKAKILVESAFCFVC